MPNKGACSDTNRYAARAEQRRRYSFLRKSGTKNG